MCEGWRCILQANNHRYLGVEVNDLGPCLMVTVIYALVCRDSASEI